MAVDKAGTTIVTLAQDYAFGRDGVKAFKEAIKNAKLVHEEYLPQNTTDFTAGIQRVVDKLKDQPGRKVVMVIWGWRHAALRRAGCARAVQALRH